MFYARSGKGDEKPFYVGLTSSIEARMTDYARATFAAQTDFKVGMAIRYLKKCEVRVKVGYIEYPDRATAGQEEKALIERLRKEVPLMNDLEGYNYRLADRGSELKRVHAFCNKYLLKQ